MADKLLLDLAHTETQRHIHPIPAEEVVSRCSPGETSRSHEGGALLDGHFHVRRNLFKSVSIWGRATLWLQQSLHSRQFQTEEERNNGGKDKYLKEEKDIGNGSFIHAGPTWAGITAIRILMARISEEAIETPAESPIASCLVGKLFEGDQRRIGIRATCGRYRSLG